MSTISTTVKINDAFSNPLDRLSSGLQKAQSGMSKLKEAISGGSSGGSMFKSMVGGTVVGGAINKSPSKLFTVLLIWQVLTHNWLLLARKTWIN